jgi:hypothetical protein
MNKANSKFRQNAYSLKEIWAYNDLEALIQPIFRFLDVSFEEMDKTTYLKWTDLWKRIYNNISELSRESKQLAKKGIDMGAHQRTIALTCILANTMLNARQCAKDYRRRVSADDFLRDKFNAEIETALETEMSVAAG